ncbi:MAG: response regulator transcription factor [Planctomycetes bacterium]|nr:response regulator transcription factor [Planctomycetota bacterium]
MQNEATIFLVDDDTAALDSLSWLLESAGFDVETYNSAVEYLNAHDPQKPGCLVLDVCMPGMDGLELQEKLVAIGQRIPIVFVSGHGDVPMSVQAMKAGATDFLEKPVDGQLLLRVVRRALAKDLKRREQEPNRAEIEKRMDRISRREREVMELLYAGKSMKKIALDLEITVQTVAKHRTQVLEKMEVEGDAELVRLLATYRLQEP